MSSNRRSGKVVHDPRGTAVWDWDIATAVLAEKNVTDLMTALDEPGVLALEEAKPAVRPRDWSGDPYNRSPR